MWQMPWLAAIGASPKPSCKPNAYLNAKQGTRSSGTRQEHIAGGTKAVGGLVVPRRETVMRAGCVHRTLTTATCRKSASEVIHRWTVHPLRYPRGLYYEHTSTDMTNATVMRSQRLRKRRQDFMPHCQWNFAVLSCCCLLTAAVVEGGASELYNTLGHRGNKTPRGNASTVESATSRTTATPRSPLKWPRPT